MHPVEPGGRNRPLPIITILLFLAVNHVAASPTLVSATLTVSVDDIADIWVNGTPMANVQYTPTEKGLAVVELKDLCVFGRVNVLAIRVTDTGATEVGIAYILRLMFSDGRWLLLSSSEEDLHRCLWVKDPAVPEPAGWALQGFDDSAWNKAYNLGAYFPGMKSAEDTVAKKSARFMSASWESTNDQQVGERHLFRRSFLMDITVGTGCLTPTASWTPSPKIVFSATPTKTWTATASRTATQTRTPSPAPTRTYTVVKRPTRAYPTWTPSDTTVPRRPTRTPTPRVRKPYPTWTPTPTLQGVRRVSVSKRAATDTPVPPPRATRTKGSDTEHREIVLMKSEERVVFERPPLSFFVAFVDPGVYRIDVSDMQGRPIRTLFDENVKARREQWVEWDGKDASRSAVPAGEYTVVYFRDGRPVRKITAVLQNR